MASSMSTATAASQKPLGTFQIYKEAFNLLKKNMKLILYVFLIYLITSILLVSVNQLSIQPLIQDITKKYIEMQNTQPTDPMFYKLYQAIMNEFKEVAIIGIVFTVIGFIISAILGIMVIYAFSLNYVENNVTLKEVLYKVKGNLKGPIITKLLVALLNFGYSAIFVVMVYLLWFLGNGSFLVIVSITLVSILALIWYLYLNVWWGFSTIVSVIEEGCYGIDAFKRSSDLMKGRKWRGVSILLLYLLIIIVISAVYGFAFGSSNYGHLWSQLLLAVVLEVFGFFFFAAMTVYYYECKKSLDHDGFLVTGNTVYSTLPTTDLPV